MSFGGGSLHIKISLWVVVKSNIREIAIKFEISLKHLPSIMTDFTQTFFGMGAGLVDTTLRRCSLIPKPVRTEADPELQHSELL